MSEREKSKQVQCTDCWHWIDANEPHTCKQQVRRNRKSTKTDEARGRRGKQTRSIRSAVDHS